jgi:nucleotidyltransferase/DNA polymerase involved in DNA repair
MGPSFVEGLPVGKFHGIGPATSAKMNSLGLYTGLHMRNQTLDFMQAHFGRAGAYYYWISRGVDKREVRANRIRKSVGAENTFSADLTEFDGMVAELQPLIDKVWRHCEDKGSRGRTVTLKVKFNDFKDRDFTRKLGDVRSASYKATDQLTPSDARKEAGNASFAIFLNRLGQPARQRHEMGAADEDIESVIVETNPEPVSNQAGGHGIEYLAKREPAGDVTRTLTSS